MKQKDLDNVALRLEADEKLKLRYRWPVEKRDNDGTLYEERTDPLLDVAEETGVFFVSHNGDIMKVWLNEAIEVLPLED